MDRTSAVDNSVGRPIFEDDERLSKMPTANFEQLNLAKLLSKSGGDAELRQSVSMLQDLANCTEDEAATALYDCENDIQKAVELLLDKSRSGLSEDWHTTGKKSRAKSAQTTDQSSSRHANEDQATTSKDKRTVAGNKNSQLKSDVSKASKKGDQKDSLKNARALHDSKNVVNSTSTESVEYRSKNLSSKQQPQGVAIKDQRSSARYSKHSDGWDPYTEYGEWGGEAIEVLNSNASLAHNVRSELAKTEDLFVETNAKHTEEPLSTQTTESSVDAHSPKSASHSSEDSLFITKATSKAPPPAFKKLPDIAVFIVPDALTQTVSNLAFRFGGDEGFSFRSSPATNTNVALNKSPISLTRPPNVPPELGTQYYSPSPARGKQPVVEASKPGGINLHPDVAERNANTPSPNFIPNQFQNVNLDPKSQGNLPTNPAHNKTAFNSDRPTQPGFLESSLKNYILENLPGEMSKLSVTNSSLKTESPVQFTHSVSSQTQQANSSFAHGQPSVGGSNMQQQMSKNPMPTTHGTFHTPHQPISSNSSQQPQATTLPPGMTHFISQFAPTPYHMFNLAGNSGNAPAVFEQLFHQQHRMLYDMHMQQHAATTSQNLLTSTSDAASAAGKHNVSGPINHVTAASAGIRPDILASAMGHPPQMLPTGHPFFSYPGFVLMNGYPNAFLNQQQAGVENVGSTQASTHESSALTQQPNQSSASQALPPMKPMNASYEEFLDMKYGDPSKQVGYKSQPSSNFNAFSGPMANIEGLGPKMPTGHSTTNGVLNSGFTMNPATGSSGNTQAYLPQYYQPGTSSSAYLNAAVAAAQHQQHQSQHTVASAANQSNPGQGSGNPGQMHQLSGAQTMMLGSSGSNAMHHTHHPSQRPVMSHQH